MHRYLVIFVLFLVGSIYAQDAAKKLNDGNEHYNNRRYKLALSNYDDAAKIKPGYITADFNKACAYYKLGMYDEAIKIHDNLMQVVSNKDTFALVSYNNGNCYFKKAFAADSVVKIFNAEIIKRNRNGLIMKPGEEDTLTNKVIATMEYRDTLFIKSIESYKKTLRIKPSDEQARTNLAKAQKILAIKQKQTHDMKKSQQKDVEPTPFAVKIKKQADVLVQKHQFVEADALMEMALKQDKSVEAYKDYMKKIKDVIEINKLKNE